MKKGDEEILESGRWMQYALEDLSTAENLVSQPSFVPRHVCWLAEQSVEKALKAVLIFLQLNYPRTHDLDVLWNLIPDEWLVKSKYLDLSELTEWAVEARYPGSWPEATQEDALSAVTQARTTVEIVREEIMRRGVDLN